MQGLTRLDRELGDSQLVVGGAGPAWQWIRFLTAHRWQLLVSMPWRVQKPRST